jgi:hypothetical protein
MAHMLLNMSQIILSITLTHLFIYFLLLVCQICYINNGINQFKFPANLETISTATIRMHIW